MPYVDVIQTGLLEIDYDEEINLTIDVNTAKEVNSNIRDAICASFPDNYVFIDDYFRVFSEDRASNVVDDCWDLELKVEVDASSVDYQVTGAIIPDEVDNDLFTENFKALPFIGKYIKAVRCTVYDFDEINDIDWFDVEEREKDQALDDAWDFAHGK